MLKLVKKPANVYTNATASENMHEAMYKSAYAYLNAIAETENEIAPVEIFKSDTKTISSEIKTLANVLLNCEKLNDFDSLKFNVYNSKTQNVLETVKKNLNTKNKFYSEIENKNFIFVEENVFDTYISEFVKESDNDFKDYGKFKYDNAIWNVRQIA